MTSEPAQPADAGDASSAHDSVIEPSASDNDDDKPLMEIVAQRAQRDEVGEEGISTEEQREEADEKQLIVAKAGSDNLEEKLIQPVMCNGNGNEDKANPDGMPPSHINSSSTHTNIHHHAEGDSGEAGAAPRPVHHALPGAFAVRPTRDGSGVAVDLRGDDANPDDVDEAATVVDVIATSQTPSRANGNAIALEATLAQEDDNRGRHERRVTSRPPEDIEEGVIEGKVEVTEAEGRRKIAIFAAFVVLLTVIVLLALGLAGVFENSSATSNGATSDTSQQEVALQPETNVTMVPTSTPRPAAPFIPTLQKIQQSGVLGCAILPFDYPGYQFHNENGELEGFLISMCQAVAAAALGNKSLVKYTPISGFPEMFQDLLYNDDVDVLSIGVTYTMERQVNESSTGTGITFTLPHFYTGLGLGGDPFFVDCASRDLKHYAECRDLSVCVVGSTDIVFAELIHPRQVIATDSAEENYASFLNGTCNLIAGGHLFLGSIVKNILYERGYQGNFTVGDFSLEKEPLTMATTSEDPVFSDFIKVVIQSLFVAEQHNITQQTSHLFPITNLFGEDYKYMFQNAVHANGNMGEINGRYMEQYFQRTLTKVNDGTTGLLTTDPLGKVSSERIDTIVGLTLQLILNRGKLRCAVPSNLPGFSVWDSSNNSWAGMNVDFCLSLASAIFSSVGGEEESVIEYVEINEPRDGFPLLASHEVDVVAGAFWNLENDIKEATTGMGFSFSLPYFYGYSEEQDNLCLATRQDDHQWSTFVYWTVAATIFAEEHNITQRTFQDMPEVGLFGPNFTRIFRSTILAVGNYGEIYEKNVEHFIHRGPPNLLNVGPHFGPQVYALPGMI